MAWPEVPALDIPGVAELVDHRIELCGPYSEIRLLLPVDIEKPLWYPRLTDEVRRLLLEIGANANKHRKAQNKPPLLFHRYSGGLLTEPLVRIQAASDDEPCRPSGLDNVWLYSPAADVDDQEATGWADPYEASRRAVKLAESVAGERPTREPEPFSATALHVLRLRCAKHGRLARVSQNSKRLISRDL